MTSSFSYVLCHLLWIKNKDSFVLEWLAQTCPIILLFWRIAPSCVMFLFLITQAFVEARVLKYPPFFFFFFFWSPKWGSWSQAFLAQPSKTGFYSNKMLCFAKEVLERITLFTLSWHTEAHACRSRPSLKDEKRFRNGLVHEDFSLKCSETSKALTSSHETANEPFVAMGQN